MVKKVKTVEEKMNLELSRMCASMANFVNKELNINTQLVIDDRKALHVMSIESGKNSPFKWELVFDMMDMDNAKKPKRYFIIKEQGRNFSLNVKKNSDIRFLMDSYKLPEVKKVIKKVKKEKVIKKE